MTTIRTMLVAAGLSLVGHAWAAGPAADAADAQYTSERARCMSGSTGQDQTTCLRSAAAARDALRQDRMGDANTAYRDNALARCRTLPPDQRVDCESRVDGAGSASGSVKDGGILRETVTKDIPAPVAK